MAEYLFYWRYETVLQDIGDIYEHGGSEQFKKVNPGDILWVVTYNAGRLFLVGRMQVGWRGSQRRAQQILGTRDLWDATYHVVAEQGTAELFAMIDITEEAYQLRFDGTPDQLPRNYTPQSFRSMRKLVEESGALLASIWYNRTAGMSGVASIPEEIPDPDLYVEGATKKIYVNTYERDRRARAACIKHYGTHCSVCDFDFEKVYGKVGKGYIQVHHLKPLSEIGNRYKVDPIKDLRPVCPNCHAMIHQRRPDPYSIEEMRSMFQQDK
jgi:hypothetical protein